MKRTTIGVPLEDERPDIFWQMYFSCSLVWLALHASKGKIAEITFQAEKIAKPPTRWQKFRKRIPQPEVVTVTMKEFSPSRILLQDDGISFYTTEEEAKTIRELKLNEEVVHLSYIMNILPNRHKVSFHIGNLLSVTFAA